MAELRARVREINGKVERWTISRAGSEATLERLGCRVGDEYSIPLEQVLDSNGSGSALYFLKALEGYEDFALAMRLYAARCAASVLDIYECLYPDDPRPRQAVEAAEAYVWGRIDKYMLRRAGGLAAEAAKSAHRKSISVSYKAAEDIHRKVSSRPFNRYVSDALRYAKYAALSAKSASRIKRPYYAAHQAWGYAMDAADDASVTAYLESELRRLCRLEGDYGEVDK